MKTRYFVLILSIFLSTNAYSDNPENLRNVIDSGDIQALNALYSKKNGTGFYVEFKDYAGNIIKLPALGYSLLAKNTLASYFFIKNSVGINDPFYYDNAYRSPLSVLLERDRDADPLLFMMLERKSVLNVKPSKYTDELIDHLKKILRENVDLYEISGPVFEKEQNRRNAEIESVKSLIVTDNVNGLQALISRKKEFFGFTIDVIDENNETKKISLIDFSVRNGSLKCFQYLVRRDRERNPFTHAINAIKFNKLNILRHVVSSIREDDFSLVLEAAYTTKNNYALKIILPHIKNIENVHMFNGQSLFDYAWRTQDIKMVMDTINSFKNEKEIQEKFKYVHENNLESIKRNVDKDNLESFIMARDCTLIHLAAFLGRSEILKYLLSLSESKNKEEYGVLGSQAIFLAVIMKHKDCFMMLADHEKKLGFMNLMLEVYTPVTEPWTLVDFAYSYLGPDAAKYLYSKKIENSKDLLGVGLYSHDLNMAIKNNDTPYITYLLTEYEPKYALCTYSLETAIEYNRYAIINLFVEKGYDNNLFGSLIEKAISMDNVEMYKFLVKLNPGYDRKNDLYLSVTKNSVSILNELLKNESNINRVIAKNERYDINENTSLLFAAVKDNHLGSAELLLKHAADVNYVNPNGKTVLFQAVENKNLKMVELLLKFKADINVKYRGDFTYLTYSTPVFQMNFEDKEKKIFTVIDINESYPIYKKLREAGAKYAWE